MKKLIKSSLNFIPALLILGSLIFYSCTEIVKPVADAFTINGKITFTDSNFVPSGGTYVVSSFQASVWTQFGTPGSEIPITPRRVNDSTILEYSYRLDNNASGDHVVCVEYRDLASSKRYVLGIYGCDTSHSSGCYLDPPQTAFINTTAGVLNIDFKAMADTSQPIFTSP